MELYQALVQFRDSNLGPFFVREADDDRIIKVIRVNEKNRGKSLVELRFTEEEYMNIFIDDKDNHNNNASIIAACESRYSGNLFVDTYWGDDEMRQGYTLHYFNEENLTLFKNIIKLVNPPLANFQIGNNEDVGEFFYQNFSNEADEIGGYYADYYDETLKAGCLEYVNKKLCGKFDNFGIIEKECKEVYLTTVSSLIHFWDKTKTPHEDSLIDMFKNFVGQNNLEFDEDLYDDYYSYWSPENWDNDGFNREVNRILDRLYNRLVEDIDPEELEKMQKFYKLLDKFNYSAGHQWHNFPVQKTFGKKNENKIFRIEGFEDGKIKILHKPDKNNYYGVEKLLVDVDDFYNFLYHPELF
jgi:hypothetical protein